MKINKLSEEIQEEVNGLRHGSVNVESYVKQSIDEAPNWNEAQSSIKAFMDDLIAECQGVIELFCVEH